VRVPLRFDPNVRVRGARLGRGGVGLFPGAIVALRGKNGGGGWFLVSEVLTVSIQTILTAASLKQPSFLLQLWIPLILMANRSQYALLVGPSHLMPISNTNLGKLYLGNYLRKSQTLFFSYVQVGVYSSPSFDMSESSR
jgi:hypothetical protein